MHSDPTTVEVKPGATLQVTVGGVGRPVVGKLVVSDPQWAGELNQGYRSLNSRMPPPPPNFSGRNPNAPEPKGALAGLVQGIVSAFSARDRAQAWTESEEFKEAMRRQRQYSWTFADDGTFRIENVVPGGYMFWVQVNDAPPGKGGGRPVGNVSRQIDVPPIEGVVSDEPYDLGTITLPIRDQR